MSFHFTGFVVLLSAAAAAEPRSASYPQAGLLIEADVLARQLPTAEDIDLRLLDARPRLKYQAGHIPGAVWVDHDAWSEAFAAGQDAGAWSKRIHDLGIGPGTTVVVYDDNRSKEAARIWWILRYSGLKSVKLLNGGWLAWQSANGPVSQKKPAVPQRKFVILKPDADLLTSRDQLLKELKDPRVQIIDARSEKEYCGTLRLAKRGGSIPGAINLDWSDLVDKKTHRFKSPAELDRLFKEARIDLNRPAVAHCQSGGRASVMVFALDLMGAKAPSNYYRGWAEWGNSADTPIARPKPKPER